MDALILAIAAMTAAGAPTEVPDTVRPLQEVVVTGTSAPLQRNLMPYSVSIVGRDRLDATGQTQVLPALSGMVPSLFVTQRGVFGMGVSNGGAGHIKLRGVGGDRASGVLLMMDGQPQFAGIYSHHISDFYDKEFVERVEVLRGPGSVLYGSNAMAGAINIITRRPGREKVRTTLTSQFGSYNTWLSSLTNMLHLGRFSSVVSASYNRTDGNVKGFDFRQGDVYAKASYSFSPAWTATADYTFMKFTGRDPIYPRLSDPESAAVYRQEVIRGEASATLTDNLGPVSGALRLYYSYGNHYIDDPRHFHSTDDRLGAIIYQNFSPWRGADATLGFDFDRYSGRIPVSGGQNHKPGSMSTMGRRTIMEYSPYLTLSQTFMEGLINIGAGLRLALSDRFHTQWVPQAGFSVNPGMGWNIKANLAMGYRNPSFRELYLYRMANPGLKPEKMMNYEVAVAKSFSRLLTADVTFWYSRGTDMIQVLDMKNQNTGRFYNKGIEVSLHSRPFDNLHLNASYSWLHTSLRNLTGAPRNQYYFGAEWTPLAPLTVCADVKGAEGLFVSEGMKRQSYALLNFKISYTPWKLLTLFVRLENVTDARYEINRGYEMPGFTAFGGFTLRF